MAWGQDSVQSSPVHVPSAMPGAAVLGAAYPFVQSCPMLLSPVELSPLQPCPV